MTEEKETPETPEAESEAPEEEAQAEAPKEKAESETPEEEAEAEAPEEKAEAEAAEEEAQAEAPEEKAQAPAVERYTRGQLQRLTTKKLREIGIELGEISGVHGMKKDELVDAIFSIRGIEEADATAEVSVDKTALKSEIKDLKALREDALKAGNEVELKRVRKRIKRLKRALRRAS